VRIAFPVTLILLAAGFTGCSGDRPVGEPAEQKFGDEAANKPEIPSDPDSSGLIDLKKAQRQLKGRKFEDLLEAFEPAQVPRLSIQEREVLSKIFYQAALALREKFKNVSYSSMFCERGLMLQPKRQPLLRLQIRNYLHPDMKLFGGAEELAETLLAVDNSNAENQLLRGKIAFEQGEYDTAVVWLKKAARVGREKRGKVIEEAWHLLDLAKGKRDEIKSNLSMTRELEAMLKRARKRSAKAVAATPTPAASSKESVTLSGGRVILYMTSWCKYCQKAQALLRAMKVKFETKNIEKDESALMEMMGHARDAGVEVTGVPVLKIGSKLVVGYNPQRIERLVDQIR
jgi:glutaredoxin